MSNFRLFLPRLFILRYVASSVESSIISVFHFFILDSRSEKRRKDRLENEESVDFPLRRKPGSGEKRRRKFPPLSSVPFQSIPFSTIFFSPRTKQTEPNSKTLFSLGQPRQGALVSFSLISSFSLPHPFLSNKFDYSSRKVYIYIVKSKYWTKDSDYSIKFKEKYTSNISRLSFLCNIFHPLQLSLPLAVKKKKKKLPPISPDY